MALPRVDRPPYADDEPVREPIASLDPDHFTPRLLALLSNALVWRESHELRRRYGLGTNDWRVISALALRPGSSASEVTEYIGLNKAVISKSVSVLSERGLIVLDDGPRGTRPLYLTGAGVRMHDQMLPISMRGQELVLAHLSQSEIDDLNDLLLRMLEETRILRTLDNENAAAEAAAESPSDDEREDD